MQSKFYIRLGSDCDSASAFRTQQISATGETQPSLAMAGADLATAASGKKVIVIVPATDLLLTTAVVPSRNRQRIISAVPYLVEDQLASEVEQLHFVIGAPDAAGEVTTVVVEHQKMQQWLALLRAHNVEPHMIVADLCCLPRTDEGSLTILLEAHSALVSTGYNRGFAVDCENLPLLLRSTLQACEKREELPSLMRVISTANGDELSLITEVASSCEVEPEIEESDDAMLLLAQGLDENRALNLLQGQYSRREQIGKMLRPWRAAAALLLALILFSGGMTVADYFELNREKAALQERIDQTYLAACPGAKRVVDAHVQMKQCLKKLRGGGAGAQGSGVLDMVASIGEALKAAGGLQLQRLSYRNGQLDMALAISDIQGLDQLKQRIIKDAGLQVEILSATSRDNRIEARLQLKVKDA